MARITIFQAAVVATSAAALVLMPLFIFTRGSTAAFRATRPDDTSNSLSGEAVVPTPIGMPNCVTSCGDVDVPYTFGIGQDASYLPPLQGLNLTCDTSGGGARERLLLDADGTLQVLDITDAGYPFLQAQRSGDLYIDINAHGNRTFGSGLRHSGPYTLASWQTTVKSGHAIVASLCDGIDTEEDHQSPPTEQDDENSMGAMQRSGGIPYCRANIVMPGSEDDDDDNEVYSSSNTGTSSDYDVRLRWLGRRNRGADLERFPMMVLVAENWFLLSPVYDDLLMQSDICMRSRGGVEVPYPFGIGPSKCYWPGFGLVCTHDPPRLLLRSGQFQVVSISLPNTTMRVIQTDDLLTMFPRSMDTELPGGFHSSFDEEVPYSLSAGNVLVITQYGMPATMVEHGNPAIISGCASLCSHNDTGGSSSGDSKYCCGNGWCKALISESTELVIKWMVRSTWFNAEEGWFDPLGSGEKPLQDGYHQKNQASEDATEVPILLRWEVLLLRNGSSSANVSSSSQPECNWNQAARDLCKCKQSHCEAGNIGYSCQCNHGYHGNPYIHDGCKGTIRIIGLTIGAGLLLLALIAYFIYYKFKHSKAIFLKREYYKKNRRQLLQQLVPQRADIAEKMIITLEDLEKATNNFDKTHELGRGGHAIVYKGILSDLYVVAIKKPTMVVQREIDEFINEVAILSQINHRNIVKLYGCCLETEVPLLVYEFISNGTLYGHLHLEGPRSLPWNARLRIATEIAKALAYLHSTTIIPVIHRDVKPANILLDDTLTAKIADFGASRYIPLDRSGLTTMVQGTIGYLDPMYFHTCRLTVKSDVYSFGVMLIELMTRKKPCSYIDSEGNGLVAQFSTLFAEGSLSQVLDPQVMDEGGNKIEEIAGIAVSCVKLRGEERPTMRQVEMRLEAAQPPEEFATISPSTIDGGSREGSTSRQYSMEEEYMLSARYPR